MVVFTWVWVNRLEPPDLEAPDSTTSTTADTAAVSPDGTDQAEDPEAESTTTTRIPPEVEVYLNNLADDRRTLAEVVAEMNAANEEWDSREVPYGETEAALVSVAEQALVFSTAVELHRPPGTIAGLVDAHQVANDAAVAVAAAAEDVLAGLRAPDTGELRRAALVEFRAAAASFDQAVGQINDIILQGFDRG